MFWVATAELDNYQLVNIGPGPRLISAEPREENWAVTLTYNGDGTDYRDLGEFETEQQAYDFMNAIAVSAMAFGCGAVIDKEERK